jgi:hypothetical protein
MPLARLIAIVGAVATIGALILQYVLEFAWMPGAGLLAVTWRYFGYFTIVTNWLVVAVWIGAALGRASRLNTPVFEGMTLTGIAMVGIVYHLLLASRWRPEGAQWWADLIVHTVTPILFALYWLLRAHGALKWWNGVLFVLWPLAYCIYALVRGAFDGWYAYYFLDPRTTPLPQLALSIAGQSAGFLAAAFIVIALDKTIAARASRSPQPAASSSAL